jgi:hypothetical protein
MKMIRTAGASLLVLLLVACSELPRIQSAVDVSPVDERGNVNSNLEEIDAASTMTALQQERLLADMERDFRVEPDANNRLRLVLLLLISNEPVRDRGRARVLLEEIDATTPLSSSQQALVLLLSRFFESQETMLGQMESCIEQVAQQERRINELEEQQKELTSIEQNIQHREKPAVIDNDR